MECKCSTTAKNPTANTELIDTLWNVNKAGFVQRKKSRLELIDTLWNVNMPPMAFAKCDYRINRYIMECK